ncbi:MAG TPA: outer membrane protein assembly factor BamD [Ignavibacteriaceae bacterium]
MKYSIIISLLLFLVIEGCSSGIDTTNMTGENRLAYAVKLYDNEDYLEAINEFQAILLQYPGSSISDDAQFYLAKTRFARTEYILAAFEFSKLIKNMPASEFVAESQFMLAQCYYELSPNYNLDQKYTKKAIQEFQAFIDFFPTNERVPQAEKMIDELNNKLAEKDYTIARIYEKMDYLKAALIYYEDVIETYHDTPYAPLAMYNKINVLIERNRNTEAIAETEKFLDRYPDDKNADDVRKIQARLENRLNPSNG